MLHILCVADCHSELIPGSRQAGHMVPMDQPKVALQMMSDFATWLDGPMKRHEPIGTAAWCLQTFADGLWSICKFGVFFWSIWNFIWTYWTLCYVRCHDHSHCLGQAPLLVWGFGRSFFINLFCRRIEHTLTPAPTNPTHPHASGPTTSCARAFYIICTVVATLFHFCVSMQDIVI